MTVQKELTLALALNLRFQMINGSKNIYFRKANDLKVQHFSLKWE